MTKTKYSYHKAGVLRRLRIVRLLMAVCMMAILFLQLFSFEKMPDVLRASGISGVLSYVLLIALVLSELLSLPFWLEMKLSSSVTKLSIIAVAASLLMLVVLEVVAYASGQTILFGATFDLPGGEWSLSVLAALAVLGLWGMVLTVRDTITSRQS